MIIRFAQEEDCSAVAQLHAASITTAFLSTLGIGFLTRLYKTIRRDKGSVLYVAESDGEVNAFVAGTVHTGWMYRRVLFTNFLSLGLPLLKKSLNMRILKKIIETIRYGMHKDAEVEIKPELLAIAVSGKDRGSGIGKKLVNNLETFFIKHGIKRYRVVTFADNKGANWFYISCGFMYCTQFLHHGKKMNEYVKNIE